MYLSISSKKYLETHELRLSLVKRFFATGTSLPMTFG